jgi:EAL domain-containing protein (putative c-di-GMP-specific phosphodiesterase class I)
LSKTLDQPEWYLEGYLGNQKMIQRWSIQPLPYRVGRNAEMHLSLPFQSVSGQHAEFHIENNSLHLRDLGSTNGTFINRKRITEDTVLQEHDVLHFSECEFRVGRTEPTLADPSQTIFQDLSETNLPEQMALGASQFKKMLMTQAVIPFFQPIVDLVTGVRIGYEVLGRGHQEGLVDTPSELFRIAASLGLETELSRLFRIRGVEGARLLKGTPKIFVNTHPSELDSPKLMTSLKTLRRENSQMPLILEIHEGSVTDLTQMRQLRSQLSELDIELAYDDFGSGQARLLELAEVPPDYLKFDISLIRGIHNAGSSRQTMVESLVKVGTEIGVPCLAEGVEKEEEAKVCTELGFQLVQGFLYGLPAPAQEWID